MTDEQVLNLLRQQIQAEQDKAAELRRQNDLAEASLKQAQEDNRNRVTSDRNKLKISLDTNEKVSGLLAQLPQVILTMHHIREWLEERDKRDERVERILLLLLSRGRGKEIDEAEQDLRRSQWHRQLKRHVANLNELEEQKAEHGISVPLELLNSIRKEKEAIEKLNKLLST